MRARELMRGEGRTWGSEIEEVREVGLVQLRIAPLETLQDPGWTGAGAGGLGTVSARGNNKNDATRRTTAVARDGRGAGRSEVRAFACVSASARTSDERRSGRRASSSPTSARR